MTEIYNSLFILLLKTPIVLVPAIFVLSFAYKRSRGVFSSNEEQCHSSGKWRLIILLIAFAFFTCLSLLLSTAWVKGDDWIFLSFNESRFLERLTIATRRYLSWVSRGGEFYGTIIGLSFSRWENWLLASLVAAAAPFAFFSLVKEKGNIFSLKGLMFYVSIFCLCLLGVNIPVWRNYWCYAAAVNYLFPTVLAIWFLSYFRTGIVERNTNKFSCCGLFLMGVLSGWGTECMTVTILPILTMWVLYNLFSKNNFLPLCSYWGYVGFLVGAFLLFASPALSTRGSLEAESIGTMLKNLSPEQMKSFLQNIDDTTIMSLRGSSGIITLKDIPLLDHVHFVPFLTKRFLSCCAVSMIFYVIVYVCYIFQEKKYKLRILVPAVFLFVSFVCAYSYLVQCIPTVMSFLPPCFILIAGLAYMIQRIKSVSIVALIAIMLFGTACFIFIPAGIEGWAYKKYELARHNQIIKLRENGVRDIVLERPYPVEPKDPISLIKYTDLKANANQYPNGGVAGYYKVKSIIQKEGKR